MTNATDDIVEGKGKQVEGRIEGAVGNLTDNDETKAKGAAKQAEGNVQEGVGHVKAAIENAVKSANR
jgi:uncharacterized protein YjbJ (UPF0337 family)